MHIEILLIIEKWNKNNKPINPNIYTILLKREIYPLGHHDGLHASSPWHLHSIIRKYGICVFSTDLPSSGKEYEERGWP
jgi:hypothetical protein